MDTLSTRYLSTSRNRRNSSSAASASTSPSPRLRHSPLLGGQGNNGNGASDSTDSIVTDPSAAHHHRLRKPKSKSRLLSKQRSSTELSSRAAAAAAAAAASSHSLDTTPATLSKSKSGSFFGLLRPISSKQRLNASWIPTEPVPHLHTMSTNEASAGVNGSKAPQPRTASSSSPTPPQSALEGGEAKKDLHGLFPFEGIGSFNVSQWPQTTTTTTTTHATTDNGAALPAAASSSKSAIRSPKIAGREHSSSLDVPASDGPQGTLYATAPPSIAGTDTPSGGHDSPAMDGGEKGVASAPASRGPSIADEGMTRSTQASSSEEDARSRQASTSAGGASASVWQAPQAQGTAAPALSAGESSAPAPPAALPSATSLKEIRRKAAQRSSVLPALDIPNSNVAAVAGPGPSTSATPARARHVGLAPRSAGGRDMLSDEEDEQDDGRRQGIDGGAEDEDDDDLDLPNAIRARRNNRRMTMMDFLSAEPPASAPALGPTPRSASGPAGALPASASSSSPSPSSLAVPNATTPRRIRQRPQSMIAGSPVRDDESGAPGGRGMSAMEFLATAAPPASASTLDSPLRSRAVDEDRVPGISRTAAKTQEEEERAERRRKRQEQREKEVTLSIEPMVDTVNMFGSTQTSANYSLSGHVLVTVPRPQRVAAGASPPRPITIKSLSLTFAGFSTYVDLSGRYSGIKLCEVPQELLADGATLPLASDLEAEETATNEPFRYKIQFDLNIPGWLPGSAYSRFGATFYCVGASAVVHNAQGMPSTVSSSERPLLTAEPESLAPTVGEHGELLPNASPTQQMQQLLDVDGDGSSRQRNRGRESWLSKRAKQLSLKSRAASTSTNEGQDQRIASASSFLPPAVRPSISARLDGGGKKWQADGSLLVKSNKYLIVLRRCRDVIPVPVARLAIVGDSLPEGAQDPPPAPVSRQASQQQEDRAQRELPLPPVPEGRASTETPATAAAAATTSGDDTAAAPAITEPPTPPQPAPPARAPPAPLPAAPSALNAPSDPSKLAMAARHPPAPVRTSSAIGAGHDGASATMTGDATSSSNNGTGAPPMRHFLHRPILHPPIDSGIEEGDGLPFSLTISVPSHIQVQNADILTFGIQVEVGRTPAWTKVRDLGGLRLRDMELMCTQSERHTSVPSRTFCATFPVPPEPKVKAIELPVLPAYTPPMGNRAVESSQEVRVRSGYDPEPLRSHLALLDAGKRLAPEENDVERVRSNVVGPPPSFQPKEAGQVDPPLDGKGKGKGKDRRKSAIGLQGSGAAGASGSGTSGSGTTRTQAGVTPPLPPPVPPLPSSVDVAPSSTVGEVARPDRQQQRETSAEARSPAPPSNTRGSSPSTTVAIGAGPPVPESATPPTPSLRSTSAAAGAPPTLAVGPSGPRRPSGPPLAMPQVTTASGTVVASTSSSTPSTTSATASTSPTTPRRAGRGRRAYEAAVRGLNSFATAVMDVGYDDGPSGSGSGGGAGGYDGNNPSARGGGGGIGGGGDSLDADQPRATYNFSGEDGHGVDLTKGRIRMTVNLPLVSSSASAARREGTPQLLSDYESPHMRVRHKLKVKLGFGFGAKPLGGEGEWGQALVMCVPVRFTEAPPREVREQFAPMPITVAQSAGDGEGQQGQRTIQPPTISLGAAGDAPVLPAYTQLFRDDGSRLNEAEDLPAYPGPRQAAGTTGTTMAAAAAAVPVPLPGSPAASLRHATASSTRPALPHRGSVTGPMTPRLNARAASFVDVTAASASGAAGPAMMTPGASSSSAAARDALNDNNGPTGPNSLAPESVVDDALRAITDPDESLAAMREQERELRELAAGGDEDDDDPEDHEAVQQQRPVLGQRSATGAALVQMGLGIDEELEEGEGGDDGAGGEAAAVGEDTIIMGQEGHEDEDRIRAVEEELGL